MEAAAMQAYRKDLEAGAADLTASAAISKQLEEAAGGKLWREAKSEKGDTYYWNTDTNKSIWEPPGEGYLSIEEQQELTTAATKLQWKTACKQEQTQDRIRAVEDERDKEEKRAAAAREKLKARRVEDIKPVESGPIIPPGKTDAYGGWKTIRTTVPTIDYQLPKQDEEYFTVPIADEKPPPKEFKTKTVESLGGGNTSFRKRKLALTTKRNVRQREDDD